MRVEDKFTAPKSLLRSVSLCSAALAGLAMSTQAQASYFVEMLEIGSDVVATGSGSINLEGLLFSNVGGGIGFVQANAGQLQLGSGGAAFYTGISGPSMFGSGAGNVADAVSGSFVSIRGTNPLIGVVSGYTSGSILGTSSATWTGESFASLGLTEGTYVWTWGEDATADSYTLRIGEATSTPVPEPATGAMMLLGFAAMGGVMRRRATPSVELAS